MHAFDSQSGRLLRETSLPFAGHATPATHTIDGRQYVVIAAGGGRDPKWPSGDVYVTFALPVHRKCRSDSQCGETSLDQFSVQCQYLNELIRGVVTQLSRARCNCRGVTRLLLYESWTRL